MARRSGAGVGGVQTVNGDAGPDVVIDATDVGALPIAGGTMTGDIDMDGNSLIDPRLVSVETAISATTAALGLADAYIATDAPITITISTADIVEGRSFLFSVLTTASNAVTPVTIATEGAQSIDGAASVDLAGDYTSLALRVSGGELVSK